MIDHLCNFMIFWYGAYGIQFAVAPQFVIDMNYNYGKPLESLFIQVARVMGGMMLSVCYLIFSTADKKTLMPFITLLNVVVTILGPIWGLFIAEQMNEIPMKKEMATFIPAGIMVALSVVSLMSMSPAPAAKTKKGK
jgi:hypothetical protein